MLRDVARLKKSAYLSHTAFADFKNSSLFYYVCSICVNILYEVDIEDDVNEIQRGGLVK